MKSNLVRFCIVPLIASLASPAAADPEDPAAPAAPHTTVDADDARARVVPVGAPGQLGVAVIGRF